MQDGKNAETGLGGKLKNEFGEGAEILQQMEKRLESISVSMLQKASHLLHNP